MKLFIRLWSIMIISLIILSLPLKSVFAIGVGEESFFPLVVYGGEPEGIMAAVAAARNGVNTLLIMERVKPGGLMTYGGLNYLDLNYDSKGKNLNKGLFAEWHQQIGGNISFSITKATRIFQEMLAAEKNLTVYNNSKLVGIDDDHNLINGLTIERFGKLQTIKVKRVIDASQDADLAVKAGVPYFIGGADLGLPKRHMAVTLILHLGNIDWQRLKVDVKSNKFGPSYLNKNHAWGFVKIGQLYQSNSPEIKLRGLNIVLDEDLRSEVYINSMLIFNVKPTDEDSIIKAYQKGQKEADHVLKFLQENLSGFENAFLLESPTELYIRESRHILADYQLKVADLLANRIFEDSIALASYPLDYQASTPEYDGFVLFNPKVYGIPFRSIIPVNFNNLLVVGRSSGYSSLAAASARVLPIGMSTGEAAGVAAAISLNRNLDFKEISKQVDLLAKIQRETGLKEDLEYYSQRQKGIISDQIFLPYLEELLSWGLVIGGYNNDFKLKASISEREFAHMIVKGLKGREAPILYEWVPGSLETLSSNRPLTRDQAAMLLLAATSHRVLEMNRDNYFAKAIELGLIPNIIVENVLTDRLLNRREAYIIVGGFLKQFSLTEKLKGFRGI